MMRWLSDRKNIARPHPGYELWIEDAAAFAYGPERREIEQT